MLEIEIFTFLYQSVQYPSARQNVVASGRMNVILKKTLLLCLIHQSFASLTNYDIISNNVMQMEREGEFFFNLKSDLYSLNITRLELIREEDELIFDSGDNSTVVRDEKNGAFGFIKENRFYGQFQSNGRTFFIDDGNKVGQTGALAILYSLEDTLVDQSSAGSRQDRERKIDLDPDSPKRVIDRQTKKIYFHCTANETQTFKNEQIL